MLIKLHGSDGTPVFIQRENIAYLQYNKTWGNTDGSTGATEIHFTNNGMLYVLEHIAEVAAMLEGKDPYPAKVLFSKGSKDEA